MMHLHSGCDERQLVLFHYGELDATERARFEAHLAGCPECRTALTRLQAGLATLPRQGLQLTTADQQRFAARVTTRIQRRSRPGWSIWGGALATGLLVFVLVVLPDKPRPVQQTAAPGPGDLEMLEQLEMLQEMNLLRDLDLLLEMEQPG